MNIPTRSRSELKSYFKKNSMPTERNFADLVDGMLNFKDDGLHKLPQNPLRLEASGGGQQKALELYKSFGDEKAAWSLSLNPRVDPANDASTAYKGLSIDGQNGKSRLFIDESNGRIGIGTITPEAGLHVNGKVKIDQNLIVKGGIEQEEWINIPLMTNYVSAKKNHNAVTKTSTLQDINIPRYCKDSFGFVHLRGKISHSTYSLFSPGDNALGELPAGFQPYGEIAMATVICPLNTATLWINEKGQIALWTNYAVSWLSLDGISFKADH